MYVRPGNYGQDSVKNKAEAAKFMRRNPNKHNNSNNVTGGGGNAASFESVPHSANANDPFFAGNQHNNNNHGSYNASSFNASSGSSPPPLLFPMSAPHTRSESSVSAGSSNFRLANLSFGSAATSVLTTFDEAQEKYANQAFPVSFSDNCRVKQETLHYMINGMSFLCVERYLSGDTNDLYSKSKKLWEQIPFGHVHVALCTNSSVSAAVSQVNSPVRCHSPDSAAPLPPPHQLQQREESPAASMSETAVSHQSFGPALPSRRGYAWVATLAGLHKFGHFADAGHYRVGKETPVFATATEKADGVSCQLTAFSVEQDRFWVIGSRTKHLILRVHIPDEDIFACRRSGCEQEVSSRTMLAECVAVAWRNLLNSRFSSAEELHAFHSQIATNRWTLCFDAFVCGFERLVGTAVLKEPFTAAPTANASAASDGTSSEDTGSESSGHPAGADASATGAAPDDLDIESKLWFYAITTSATTVDRRGLCLPPAESVAFFSQFHLPCVPMGARVKTGSAEYAAQMRSIASKPHSAGAVLYGENEEGVVVAIWKCRNQPYTVERAAQEYILGSICTGGELAEKIRKKIGGLSKEKRACVRKWEALRLPSLVGFCDWLLRTNKVTPSMDMEAKKALRGSWVSMQAVYLSTTAAGTGAPAGDDGGVDDADGEAAQRAWGSEDATIEDRSLRKEEEEEEEDKPEFILLAGPQGCGKSTLARCMYVLIEQAGGAPLWLNQDEVGGRSSFLSAIRRVNRPGSGYTHVFIDKMNLDAHSRDADYRTMGLGIVLTVCWVHEGGTEELVATCVDRVKKRGDHHRTFRIGSLNSKSERPSSAERRVHGIISSCAATYEAPQGAASSDVVELSVTWDLVTSVTRVWEALQARSSYDFPPSVDALDVRGAMDMSAQYEALLLKYPHKIAKVVLEAVETDALLSSVSPDVISSHSKKILPDVQVALHNFQASPHLSLLVAAARHIGQRVPMVSKAVVTDCNATLMLFEPHDSGAGELDFLTDCVVLPRLFAVLSRTKKCSNDYCERLIDRAATGEDPYCVSIPFEEGEELVTSFVFRFLYL